MSPSEVVKTVLALFVIENLITKQQAEDMIRKVDRVSIRGVIVHGDLDKLIEILENNNGRNL